MKKVVDQTVLCKDAAGTLVFEGLPVKTAVCLTALFMNSFMTERDAGVLRKIRGKMKGGCCLKKRIPFFFSDFFFGGIDEASLDILTLFPELPGIDDVLPDDVRTGTDSSNRLM